MGFRYFVSEILSNKPWIFMENLADLNGFSIGLVG